MNVCRLCVREQDPLKDLLEVNNTSISKIVEKFTYKSVTSTDELPTKICLNCEEKLVTFELFLLECQSAQDNFLKSLVHSEIDIPVKVKVEEEDYVYLNRSAAKVKSEITVEHIVEALNNSDHDNEIGAVDDFQNSSDYDELDDIAIASLKKIINNESEVKGDKDIENKNVLFEILQKPKLRASDLFKFNCVGCEKLCSSWPQLYNHSIREHKYRPTVNCILCGYTISSQSGLYGHISKHKTKRKEATTYGWRLPKYIDFSCKSCHKKYKSWHHLRRHYEKIHPEEQAVVHCTCGRALKSKTMIYRHVEDHENPTIYKCDICQKSAKSLSALKKHQERHVPLSEREYRCSVCGKECRCRVSLRSHEKTHIPIEKRKVFVCEICNMKFTSNSAVVMHRRTVHEKLKGYVCDQCGFSCATGGELRQHRAMHSDEKPFQCFKCNKCFKTYSNLKTHGETHGDASYICHVCNRVLNSKRSLRKHLLVHEDYCKYVCPYCGKAFKRRQTLVVHQHIHTGDKPITCKLCGDKFAYASSLRTHMFRLHPEMLIERSGTQAQILKTEGLNAA